jgi:hypothetical protein
MRRGYLAPHQSRRTACLVEAVRLHSERVWRIATPGAALRSYQSTGLSAEIAMETPIEEERSALSRGPCHLRGNWRGRPMNSAKKELAGLPQNRKPCLSAATGCCATEKRLCVCREEAPANASFCAITPFRSMSFRHFVGK